MNDQEKRYRLLLKAPLRTENVILEDGQHLLLADSDMEAGGKVLCYKSYGNNLRQICSPFCNTLADSEVLVFYTVMCKMNQKENKLITMMRCLPFCFLRGVIFFKNNTPIIVSSIPFQIFTRLRESQELKFPKDS